MTYKLSLIIPVYKVEKFIEECLESVFSQLTYLVEIIIIDDGTPDQSIEIVKSKYGVWLDNDQVVLITQENAGPGAARNRGLAKARGEYVGFLDSDDVLLSGFFNLLLEKLYTYNVDIVEFGFQRFHNLSDFKKCRYKSLYTFEGIHELSEVRNEIFSIGVWFPCIRVYKKELFERIRFPVGVFYEDLMTIPHIYLKDLKVYFVNQPFIGYRYNPNSTTALHTKSHAMDLYFFYMSLMKMESIMPIEIQKIKTARSIVFFYNEFSLLNLPLRGVLSDIKKIKKRLGLLNYLNFPDLFFFIFPDIYIWIDKIRLCSLRRKKI
ncbi:MAG: glycosyltransferase family 2 protein [Candidatus Electrothrix sp. AR4]|nr:glycosyltransferase family 2 protein [Candidatus Electrothrix sp. AR4]